MQLFDGHNGSAAATYTKENLFNNVLNCIPPVVNRDEWLAALPRALVSAFVKTDKEFQEKGKDSSESTYFPSLSFPQIYIYTHTLRKRNVLIVMIVFQPLLLSYLHKLACIL